MDVTWFYFCIPIGKIWLLLMYLFAALMQNKWEFQLKKLTKVIWSSFNPQTIPLKTFTRQQNKTHTKKTNSEITGKWYNGI